MWHVSAVVCGTRIASLFPPAGTGKLVLMMLTADLVCVNSVHWTSRSICMEGTGSIH